jgi:hypothetical protein
LEDDLIFKAKQRALEERRTLGAVVNDALRMGLLGSERTIPRVEERPLITFRGSGIQPGVDLSSGADLLERMEGL